MTRVAVTGGTGFVAGWCIVDLLAAGFEVVATIRNPGREAEVRAGVERESGDQSRLSFALADLTTEDSWVAAMDGCELALHIASPLSDAGLGDTALIAAAVEGTRRVLDAAAQAGVRRVVVTSSCAAATPHHSQLSGTVDETQWTDADEEGLAAYRRSKVVAERAAWEWADANRAVELATILPAAVFGPALTAASLGSLQLIAALLDGSAIAIPRLGFEIVDVRDIAIAHRLALTVAEAAGQRFITAGELMWFDEIAETLRAALGDAGSRIPTERLSDDDFRAVAAVAPARATLLPLLGRALRHDASKARSVLGWQSRPATETVVDSARSLIELGPRAAVDVPPATPEP